MFTLIPGLGAKWKHAEVNKRQTSTPELTVGGYLTKDQLCSRKLERELKFDALNCRTDLMNWSFEFPDSFRADLTSLTSAGRNEAVLLLRVKTDPWTD